MDYISAFHPLCQIFVSPNYLSRHKILTDMNNAKTILMIISGMSIGALLGVLFAPGSGSYTRRKLSNKGNDYLENLGSGFDSILADMLHRIEKVKKEVKSLPKPIRNNR
jgi:hypothetical protein